MGKYLAHIVLALGLTSVSVSAFAAPTFKPDLRGPTLEEPDRPVIGVGLALEVRHHHVQVVDIVPGSPADYDGTIHIGDRIIAVQGSEDEPWQSAQGLSAEHIVTLIRGPEGSSVGLRIERADETPPLEVTLSRALLKALPHEGRP